jgi:hypothetical protein
VQLIRAAVFALLITPLVASGAALADGTVSVRGAYYKERATRVAQPMVDADLEAGPGARVTAHFLVDSITSASAAAGAAGTPFTEIRYELGGLYLRELERAYPIRVGGGGRISYEPDYTSVFGVARAEIDLAQRNTTVGVSIAQGRDHVTNAGAQGGMQPEITGSLNTSLASASLTQILSRDLVAGVTYDFIYLRGFQENVYRAVAAGGAFENERVPDVRKRHAVFGNVRGYFEPTRTTLMLGYRFYADDWGIFGHTPEVRLIQAIVPDVLAHARYRLYQQNKAEFYEEIYDTADPMIEPFLTADEKLSAYRTQKISGKLDVRLGVLGATGRLENAWGHLVFDYIDQTNAFGDAVSAQVAVTVPVEY